MASWPYFVGDGCSPIDCSIWIALRPLNAPGWARNLVTPSTWMTSGSFDVFFGRDDVAHAQPDQVAGADSGFRQFGDQFDERALDVAADAAAVIRAWRSAGRS